MNKKNFEGLIKTALICVFFYALIYTLCPENIQYLSPFGLNIDVVFGGLILSMVCALIFPTFSVSKYLNTQKINTISNYKTAYKVPFYFLFLGYIGLWLTIKAIEIKENEDMKYYSFSIGGFILVCMCATYIVYTIIKNPSKK